MLTIPCIVLFPFLSRPASHVNSPLEQRLFIYFYHNIYCPIIGKDKVNIGPVYHVI